jgi:hypothetical protein
MADYKKRNDFTLLLGLLERIAKTLAATGVPDAKALTTREAGMHNLQGHAMRVMPLAVWLVIRRPDLLKPIRRATGLKTAMHASSSEARSVLWRDVKVAILNEISLHGSDVLSSADKTNTPTTAAAIANTYLSTAYGGGQTKGGAGNTVLKRSLKLLAHVLPS